MFFNLSAYSLCFFFSNYLLKPGLQIYASKTHPLFFRNTKIFYGE